VKFNYRLVVLYDQILHMELRAVWENLSQLGEGALRESLLATVVIGEGWVPITVQSTSSATPSKNAAPSPFSSPLKISRTLSDVIAI
jgi:hypothetical protein